MKKLSVTMTETEKLVGWIYYPLQLLVLPMAISIINLLAGDSLSESWVNVLYFAINFAIVSTIFRYFLLDNGKIALQNLFRCLCSAGAGFIAYMFLSYQVQLLIFTVDPDFFNVNDAFLNDIVQENFGILTFCTVILVPIAEETLYRGLIFGQLYNRNRLAAYLISTLAFSAIHIISFIGLYEPMHLLLCLLQYLPAGLCLGWAYANADSIWAPILIHMTINQISALSMR